MWNFCCANPTPFPPPNSQPSLTVLNKTVGSSTTYICALGFWADTLGEPTYTCNPGDNGTVTTAAATTAASTTAVSNWTTSATVNPGINYWTYKGQCECMLSSFAFMRSENDTLPVLCADIPGYCNDSVIFPPHTSDVVYDRLVYRNSYFNCSLGFKPNATNGAPYVKCIPIDGNL